MKNNISFCGITSCLFALLLTACSTQPKTDTAKSLAGGKPSGPYLDTKKTTTEDMKKATTPPPSPHLDTKNTTTEDMKNATIPKPTGPYLDTKNTTSPNSTSKNAVIVDGCQERASVKKGETLQILLPATAGTGYAWTLAKPSTILSQIQTDNIRYKQEPSTDTKMVGTPQKQILEFTAITTGTETIEVIYSRSFEKNKVAKKCTVTVNVQ